MKKNNLDLIKKKLEGVIKKYPFPYTLEEKHFSIDNSISIAYTIKLNEEDEIILKYVEQYPSFSYFGVYCYFLANLSTDEGALVGSDTQDLKILEQQLETFIQIYTIWNKLPYEKYECSYKEVK